MRTPANRGEHAAAEPVERDADPIERLAPRSLRFMGHALEPLYRWRILRRASQQFSKSAGIGASTVMGPFEIGC